MNIQIMMMMVLTTSIQVYEWKMRSIKGIARGRRVSVRRKTEIVNEIKKKFLVFLLSWQTHLPGYQWATTLLGEMTINKNQ